MRIFVLEYMLAMVAVLFLWWFPPQISAQEKSCVAIGTPQNAGSGTIVAKRGSTCYVLTNKHVINKDSQRVWVVCAGETYKAKFVASHPTSDLTIVAVEATAKPVPIADVEPAVGGAVKHFGKSSGPQKGKLTGYTNFVLPDGKVCNLDYFSVPGDSGAGVFNAKGELCGVHYGRKLEDECGLCVRLQHVKDLIRMAVPDK